MNSFLMAMGLASIALCAGTLLRAKIPFLRNMLVPASVIAGILGVLFMNGAAALNLNVGADAKMFTDIVDHMFTISFISISLTGSGSSEKGTGKTIFKGALGMGMVWNFLYALTPLLGMVLISVIGGVFGMDPIYASLIPFGFAQGPGQAANYGKVYEANGWENAAMVGVTFAAIGFIVAFLVGIPAAKIGISRGIAKNSAKLDDMTLRGYMRPDEQTATMKKDTTVNSNIETLTFHFAIIGLCYVLAVGVAWVVGFVPGIGESLKAMMFMNGMIAAYIVKAVMKALKIDYLLDDGLQSKITGWTSDYLVVCAFMAVSFAVIQAWLIPIVLECILIAAVSAIVCFYFGQRFGGDNDFERTLGLYGTATGTVPTGIALIRIVDPNFKTNTAIEVGLTNLIMIASSPVVIVMMLYAQGDLSKNITMIALAGCSALYLVLIKVCKTWGKKTYSWKKDKVSSDK